MTEPASDQTDPRPTRDGDLSEAIETFPLPPYGPLWTSNLVQFICFHVLFIAMQWLVTELTDRASGVALLSAIQGASIALMSPFAGVVVDRYAKRNLIVLSRLGLAGIATTTALLVHAEAMSYWLLISIAVLVGRSARCSGPRRRRTWSTSSDVAERITPSRSTRSALPSGRWVARLWQAY